ncbi:hypothetical protein GCM10010530_09190 [Kribbella aluminosa]
MFVTANMPAACPSKPSSTRAPPSTLMTAPNLSGPSIHGRVKVVRSCRDNRVSDLREEDFTAKERVVLERAMMISGVLVVVGTGDSVRVGAEVA